VGEGISYCCAGIINKLRWIISQSWDAVRSCEKYKCRVVDRRILLNKRWYHCFITFESFSFCMSPFSCIITCLVYALFISIGSCYLWSEALLYVLNDHGVLNQGCRLLTSGIALLR